MTNKEWLEKCRKENYKWATDDQWECCKMIFDLIGGEHHLISKIKPHGNGIGYNINSGLATFDFNGLTTAVFMAHDRIIRLAINHSGPNRIKLCLWKRHKRDGDFWDKHPTIEQALADYKKIWRIS